MKQVLKFIAIFLLGLIIGAWVWSQPLYDPTPEQCLNVCVDLFEKYGC